MLKSKIATPSLMDLKTVKETLAISELFQKKSSLDKKAARRARVCVSLSSVGQVGGAQEG